MTVKTTTGLRPKIDPTGKERNPIQRLTNAQKLLLGSVGFTYMLTQFNQMVTETDRDGVTFYDKVPDHVKQRNLVIMFPGSAEGARMDIPKTYGFGGLADIGLTIAEVQNRERDLMDGALYLASSMAHNMFPIYFGEVGQESDPTKSVDIVKQPGVLVEAVLGIDPVAPLVNVAQNVDNFGNPIAREAKPGQSRASQATDSPSILKDIAKVLNASWMNGGSDQISGDLDFNPDALNYLLQNYLGSSYVMFGDAADVVLKQAAGQTELETFPIIKKFYGTDNEYMAYANYYQAKSVVNSYLAEFGNVEDLLENKDKPLPSRDERLEDYEAVEREVGGARKRYGNALAVAKVMQDVESELVEVRESKKTLQKQQDALEYDMFNLGVAAEYQRLEEKIYDFEQTEMLLFETALKEYYKYYAKKSE